MSARSVNGRRFAAGAGLEMRRHVMPSPAPAAAVVPGRRLRIRAWLAIVIVQSVAACWKEL
jgi:hypothetical protein